MRCTSRTRQGGEISPKVQSFLAKFQFRGTISIQISKNDALTVVWTTDREREIGNRGMGTCKIGN